MGRGCGPDRLAKGADVSAGADDHYRQPESLGDGGAGHNAQILLRSEELPQDVRARPDALYAAALALLRLTSGPANVRGRRPRADIRTSPPDGRDVPRWNQGRRSGAFLCR